MIKQLTLLSLVASTILASDSMQIDTITVKGRSITTNIKEVSKEEIKSADLAEALSKSVPSISLVRRSGIANDIILRGQKKDNINILIDGAKIYGACPNRMDPPTSHILTNNIKNVEIQEGPFDVENFGTLSGIVKINTKKPSIETTGEANVNIGSFGYRKASATISGGTDSIRVLLSASTEDGGQYEDGDGRTLAQQTKLNAPKVQDFYQTQYENMDAFEKKSFMGKVYIDLTDNQELKLSYTANRSDNILYPNSKMDALYDDSDLFNVGYTIKNLSKYSKELSASYYYSDVEHPMSTKYRDWTKNPMAKGFMTSSLEATISGLKIKNSFDLNEFDILVGLDASTRNWDGAYLINGIKNIGKSMQDVDTKNRAIFATISKEYNSLNLEFGARYDSTDIDTQGTSQDNNYNSLSANLFGTYKIDDTTEYFAGIGRSSRVPDARELYFTSTLKTLVGTPNLDETYNTEFDFGVNKKYENGTLKAKIFYSILSDYIVYNSSKTINAFENVDADIYGVELSGLYLLSDALTFDYALSYQRGKKNDALVGQTDRDLAEIPPLKANLSLGYEPTERDTLSLNLVAVDSWDTYDADNGEQELSGFAIFNARYNRDLSHGFDITLGIDNIFDRTYAISNTYKDLTLITTGTAVDDVMLLNEPGRYLYANLSYKF